MADKKSEAEQAGKQAVEDAEPKQDETKFSTDRLIRDAGQIVGHPPHVLAGALHNVKRKELTVTEAKEAVNRWLKAEVKSE